MARTIVDIQSISEAIPKYRIWYRFYEDIFISVICLGNRKSYIRRKTAFQGIKMDNPMCAWHSDWQYKCIEYNYGLETGNTKTYEIVVEHEGETHRIDSLIDTIAIEFQHSLEVSLNEIDSRFIAHKALGYTPYLMLDFTDFSFATTFSKFTDLSSKNIEFYMASYKSNDVIISFIKKVRKWLNSKYFNNENLFLDFSDQIVRLTPHLKCKILKYSNEKFIKNLLCLEDDIQNELTKEKKQLDFEKVLKAQEREKADAERAAEVKRKIKENREEVKSSNRFSWYRKCLQNNLIKRALQSILDYEVYVKYQFYESKDGNISRKYHVYNLFPSAYFDPVVEIQYVVNSIRKDDSYEFLYSEINLIKKEGEGFLRYVFEQKPKQKIQFKSKRLEYVKGILHSTSSQALCLYNEKGKIVANEYYLFNTKVTKEEWDLLSTYYEIGGFPDEVNDTQKLALKNIMEVIERNDTHDFRRYFYQNDFPMNVRKKYYDKIQEQEPLRAKHL